MSMVGGRVPKGLGEVGQTVASYPSYERAQKAVSELIAADVRARDIAIVGQGLRSIERVTGRLGYAAAARTGAVNGVLLGLLFAAILVIGTPTVPIQAFVGVIFIGIAVGMLLSIITYSLVRRRRDYASVMQVVADHYEIAVAPESAAKARQVLGAVARPAAPVAPAPVVQGPPQYGERLPVAPASDEGAPAADDSGAHTETPARDERDA